mgnify:CR=1 FL=1
MLNTPKEEEKKLEHLKKNPQWRAFSQSKDLSRVNRLISMAYLLQSIATSYTEEANSLLEKYGLMHHEIKSFSRHLTKAFDAYDKQLDKLICNKSSRKQLCDDFEYFENVCRQFMNKDE